MGRKSIQHYVAVGTIDSELPCKITCSHHGVISGPLLNDYKQNKWFLNHLLHFLKMYILVNS